MLSRYLFGSSNRLQSLTHFSISFEKGIGIPFLKLYCFDLRKVLKV